MNHWRGNGVNYAAQDRANVEIFLDEKVLMEPLHWRKPRTVFVCSMTDLFGEWVDDGWFDDIFDIFDRTSQHTYIILTKRPERLLAFMAGRLQVSRGFSLPPNAWLGVSVEDQATADERIPILLNAPATVRFVSYEPALKAVDFAPWFGKDDPGGLPLPYNSGISWLICGGESGPRARPMHPDWVRSVRDQCAAAGIPLFFKQWGAWKPVDPRDADAMIAGPDRHDWMIVDRAGGVDVPDYRWPDEEAGEVAMIRVGRKAAGALLDGRERREWPA